MIKHIVMWKLKEDACGNSKSTNAKLMKEKLEAMLQVIPEIQTLEVGLNINPAENFDVILYSTFKTLDDLKVYSDHPEHKKVSDFVSAVRSERYAIDYEV